MSKNQFTGTATQPQRNRNATANFVNLIMTSTVTFQVTKHCHQIPLYTPVATFSSSDVYSPYGAQSGLFVGCLPNGFKVSNTVLFLTKLKK